MPNLRSHDHLSASVHLPRLFNEFMEKVGAVLESATLARTWLMQMGEGARKAGLTIQYCMPYARHLLQSVEIPVVTQVCQTT